MPDTKEAKAGLMGYTGTADWSRRLYPFKGREPLYQYVKPGQNLTEAEHNLNRGALRGKWQFVEKVLPGGGEPRYMHRPEVAIGNWWERCCIEKPGFHTSLGRKLPDNLTKCSEYREEISEYAKFFTEHPDEEIRVPASDVSRKFIPWAVKMDHRCEYSPQSFYQSTYTSHFHKPFPPIPPQQFGWADEKRKQWIAEILDESVTYCTDYQKNYNPLVYDRQTEEAKKASLSTYIKIDKQNDRFKRILRAEEYIPQRMVRNRLVEELKSAQSGACATGADGECPPQCLASVTTDLMIPMLPKRQK